MSETFCRFVFDVRTELFRRLGVYDSVVGLQELKIKESTHTVDTLGVYVRKKDPEFYDRIVNHKNAKSSQQILMVIMKNGNVCVYKTTLHALVYGLLTTARSVLVIVSWYTITENVTFDLLALKRSLIAKYGVRDVKVSVPASFFTEIRVDPDNSKTGTIGTDILTFYEKSRLTNMSVSVLRELFVLSYRSNDFSTTYGQRFTRISNDPDARTDTRAEVYSIVKKLYENYIKIQHSIIEQLVL